MFEGCNCKSEQCSDRTTLTWLEIPAEAYIHRPLNIVDVDFALTVTRPSTNSDEQNNFKQWLKSRKITVVQMENDKPQLDNRHQSTYRSNIDNCCAFAMLCIVLILITIAAYAISIYKSNNQVLSEKIISRNS